MQFTWLILIIVLIVIECTTVNLTTIWFVISGILSLVSSFFTDNMLIQFGIFVIIGILLLITTKPILKNIIKTKSTSTNLDRVVGMEAIVTKEISKHHFGEVKVDGKRWTAYADDTIKTDEIVNVLEINGVKLKVEKKGE